VRRNKEAQLIKLSRDFCFYLWMLRNKEPVLTKGNVMERMQIL
jgi:hypothetical protein